MFRLPLLILSTLTLISTTAFAQGSPSSYATAAIDEVGSTGAASVALGVADYFFINDDGLGFGGTNTDSFDVGESTILSFPVPLLNVPSSYDLMVSAFVGGLGATDNATVQVEVSSDGSNFVVIDTFDTEEARTWRRIFTDRHETNFEAVKHFWIEFGTEDRVTHVRLTNLGGTAEGLRLDSVEGIHPDTESTHAFEIRFERYRVDASERFLLRIKNISDEMTGQAITGFHLEKLPVSEWMEDTIWPLLVNPVDNPETNPSESLICVDNCAGDADELPGVTSSTWAYSLDGVSPAPAGIGLEPGQHVGHARYKNVDIDALGTYLTDFTFWIEFADGVVVPFDFNNDVVSFGNIGAQYQKYTFFNSAPALSGPRPVHYFEFVALPPQVPSIDTRGLVLLVFALIGIVALWLRTRSSPGTS